MHRRTAVSAGFGYSWWLKHLSAGKRLGCCTLIVKGALDLIRDRNMNSVPFLIDWQRFQCAGVSVTNHPRVLAGPTRVVTTEQANPGTSSE